MSLWGFLMNPTVLMALGLMVLLGFSSMTMGNMDPEELKAMQEQQKSMGFDPSQNPMQMLTDMLSGKMPQVGDEDQGQQAQAVENGAGEARERRGKKKGRRERLA